jgi:hypothetical protein
MGQLVTPFYVQLMILLSQQPVGAPFYRLVSLQLHRPLWQSQEAAPIIIIGIPPLFSLGGLRRKGIELLGALHLIRKQKVRF